METPKGVYHSLTKHLFSYVEMRVTVCQFSSHCMFLCQMCCNSSRPGCPAPLPPLSHRLPTQLFSICCLISYWRLIFSTSSSSVLPFLLLSSSCFICFNSCFPSSPVLLYPPLASSPSSTLNVN